MGPSCGDPSVQGHLDFEETQRHNAMETRAAILTVDPFRIDFAFQGDFVANLKKFKKIKINKSKTPIETC